MSTGPDGAAWTLICGFGESLRPSFDAREDRILAKRNAQPREKFLWGITTALSGNLGAVRLQ